jgi:hypothetical protein
MIGKTVRPASLFAFAFFKEAASIADPILDPLDRLLEDPMLVALSSQALVKRSPGSHKSGREGIAPDRLLRCVVLKHVKGWSSSRTSPRTASQPSLSALHPFL